MAIPVQFQQFKAAGIYRVVYDKSTVLNEDAELLRLVVGYSPKGPFNTPVYVKSVSDFKSVYGDISKSLEKRGCFFHRTAIDALSGGPILCLNLKTFGLDAANPEKVDCAEIKNNSVSLLTDGINVEQIYDTTKFWVLSPDKLNDLNNAQAAVADKKYVHISAIDSVENSNSFFLRKANKSKLAQYNITVSDWYNSVDEEIPDYLVGFENYKLTDFFAEIYCFKGKFTADQVLSSEALKNYFELNAAGDVVLRKNIKDSFNNNADTLQALYEDSASGALCHYIGCLIPDFVDPNTGYQSLNVLFNAESDIHHMMMAFDTNLLEESNNNASLFDLSGISNLNSTFVGNIFSGEAKTSILGNVDSLVYSNVLSWNDTNNTIEVSETKPNSENVNDEAVSFVKSSFVADTLDNKKYSSTSNDANKILSENDVLVANADGKTCYVKSIYSVETTNYIEFSENPLVKTISITGTIKTSDGKLFTKNGDEYPEVTAEQITSGVDYYKNSGEEKVLAVVDTDYTLPTTTKYFVRLDGDLNAEIGNFKPVYLSGFTYAKPKPAEPTMKAKLEWQKNILSTISKYKGIHDALLSKSEIDYRYIVDSFETFVDSQIKSELSLLAKEKELCLAILNFPSVRTFVNCPYTKFTASNNAFDVKYVVEGGNKKKGIGTKFSLPNEYNGASFCAFYTPLKLSNGYVDDIVPSAGIVSNLFMGKYSDRFAYSIIAGPNYAKINVTDLVGPDYHYSQSELQIIEPFGVNCMVYRPGFGTFINANQTAKQTPKSALSSVNVRELVIFLQDEIGKVLQAHQWEFNNPTTRTAIKDKADEICARAKANGGIQVYKNIMDESNNTPDIIDNEMAVISTYIEAGRGCGKMIHELTLYKTGGMSSMITEE